MEDMLTTVAPNLGFAGVGFGFLWFFMKKHFEQTDKNNEQLIKTFKEASQQQIETFKESQQQQLSKSDALINKVEEIRTTQIEMLKETRKMPFGKIATMKGMLTPEQVEEILREQIELHVMK